MKKPIDLIQPKTDLLRISESNTVINADIQKLMERRLYNISVNVINIPDNMKALVIPSSLSLIIQGGVDVVAKVQEKDIIAFIDYTRHKDQSNNEFPAYIEPLPGIRYREIQPKRFKIILERLSNQGIK